MGLHAKSALCSFLTDPHEAERVSTREAERFKTCSSYTLQYFFSHVSSRFSRVVDIRIYLRG